MCVSDTTAAEGSAARTSETVAASQTIFGYGSLMEEPSVLRTCPSATHHRPGMLEGWRRVFSLVSISGTRNGAADHSTGEVAALAIKPAAGHRVNGVLFDIPLEELDAYKVREARYKFVKVRVTDAQSTVDDVLVCVEQTDAEYRATMPNDVYEEHVGQFYQGQLWGRPDILPQRQYLVKCIEAATGMDGGGTSGKGPVYTRNLLEGCVLTDGSTVRDYILESRFIDRFPLPIVEKAKELLAASL